MQPKCYSRSPHHGRDSRGFRFEFTLPRVEELTDFRGAFAVQASEPDHVPQKTVSSTPRVSSINPDHPGTLFSSFSPSCRTLWLRRERPTRNCFYVRTRSPRCVQRPGHCHVIRRRHAPFSRLLIPLFSYSRWSTLHLTGYVLIVIQGYTTLPSRIETA